MVAHSPRINLDDLFSGVSTHAYDGPHQADPDANGLGGVGRALSANAMVATIYGPVPARALVAGDRILTRDSGYVDVVSVRHNPIGAAVTIAAGILHLTSDLTLAAEAGVLLADDRFIALFGSREVLVPAQMIGRPTASTSGVTIAIAGSDLIAADTVWTEAQGLSDHAARPMLAGREAAIAARLVLPADAKPAGLAA